MTDTENPHGDDSDAFPLYAWEVYPDTDAAYLYRVTATTQKPVIEVADEPVARQFSHDPDWYPSRRDWEPEQSVVRDVFLAAVKAAFVSGYTPYSRDELRSPRAALDWYEERALDHLTDRRQPNGYRKGDAPAPPLSPDVWTFIKHARSEITLSNWIGDDANPEELKEANNRGLDSFQSDDATDEHDDDDHE